MTPVTRIGYELCLETQRNIAKAATQAGEDNAISYARFLAQLESLDKSISLSHPTVDHQPLPSVTRADDPKLAPAPSNGGLMSLEKFYTE